MKNIIKRIEIELYSPTSYEVIKAQQGDNKTRIIEFILYDQGEPYILENQDIKITMEGHRGDKSSFIKDCRFTDNIISATLDSDVLSEPGTVCAKIVMYNSSDESILSTIPFQISVQKNPCDKRKIETEKQSIIDWLILHFNQLKNILNSHLSDFSNPHKVTKEQVDLGNVPNVTTNEQTPTYEKEEELSELESGETLSKAFGKISAAIANLITHVQDHLRHITSVEREQWNDSYSKRHVHENKTILDQTTANYTTEEKNKLLSLYTASEIDNKFSTLETNIDWKESVDTFDNISTTYPDPEDGWTVNVKDTDYTYRYNGTNWVAISANAIPKATTSVDGLFSKEDYVKLESLYNGSVAGVKGNAEESYRTGNVNLTPENIGSLSTSGGRMTGSIKMEGDAYITYYTPTTPGIGHARGIDYVNPDTLERWGGIGAIGSSGVLEAIYIGANNPNPWTSNAGLHITGSDIKWKNSKMLTENSGNAVSASKLNTPRLIDGVSFDGSTDITHFGVCETAASVANKTVSIPGFQLKEGAKICVLFTSDNDALNTTLNVNSTGAKYISTDGISLIGGYSADIRRGIYEFIYYSGYWVIMSNTSSTNLVTFIPKDSIDSDAKSWSSVSKLASGMTFANILGRISAMFKNVRYLHNCLTQKGFLNKTLNISCSYLTSGYITCVYNASTVMLHFSNFQNVPVASSIVIATIPSEITPRNNCAFERTTPGGCIYRLHIQSAGSILIHRYNNNDIYNVGMTITYLL